MRFLKKFRQRTGFTVASMKDRGFPRLQAILWARRKWTQPPPAIVKRSMLIRRSLTSDTWIETGTYLGGTTRFLAKRATFVYSIEPSQELANRAKESLADLTNVRIIHGTSEEKLPEILKGISGSLALWLDGHYSGGRTFQGDADTPIVAELQAVSDVLPRVSDIKIFVDDVRLFSVGQFRDESYPSLEWLIHWAIKSGLNWEIEHDIFCAWK